MLNRYYRHLIALLLSVPLLCGAGYIINPYSVEIVSGDECTGRLLCQNFEGTGVDNGETWTLNATADPDATTAPAPLRGTQSLFMDYDNAEPTFSVDFTATGEIWLHTLFRASYFDGSTRNWVGLYNSSGAEYVCRVAVNATTSYLYVGTVFDSTATSGLFAVDTTYHIWVHLDSAGDTAELYVGTSTTRPASPSLSVTTGNATATTVDRYWSDVNPSFKIAGDGHWQDQILIDDAVFTTVNP